MIRARVGGLQQQAAAADVAGPPILATATIHPSADMPRRLVPANIPIISKLSPQTSRGIPNYIYLDFRGIESPINLIIIVIIVHD